MMLCLACCPRYDAEGNDFFHRPALKMLGASSATAHWSRCWMGYITQLTRPLLVTCVRIVGCNDTIPHRFHPSNNHTTCFVV